MKVPAWHNAVVWLSLGVYFLLLELPPTFIRGWPWEQLTVATRRFEHWWHFSIVLIALALWYLGLHLLAKLPVDWLITVAVAIAVGASAKLAWELLS